MIPKNNRDIALEEIDGEQEFRFEDDRQQTEEQEEQNQQEEENKEPVQVDGESN